MVSGSLISKIYNNFTGVDFSDSKVAYYRSPDSLNMFKDYEKSGNCIETRPGIVEVMPFDNTVFGLFFYKTDSRQDILIHTGTKLFSLVQNKELFTGMKPAKSQSFFHNNILYIKDGINFLKYDGETVSEVIGYIPTTSIGRRPAGGGTTLEDVNMLSPYRKNSFLADGESKDFYLDATNIDGECPVVMVGTELKSYPDDFDYDPLLGKITFKEAPPLPLTEGQDTVFITFKKTVEGYADRIKRCNLLAVFDNRVFFSGNPNYPNTVFHSSLNDPSYCSDLDYYNEGLDSANVKALIPGNNALWVIKEPSEANTTVFYHNPVVDAEYGKIYPSTHSSISIGCNATGINFNDDIVFFSNRGMEGISGDITSEQVLGHRSTLVDARLLAEENYTDMILEEWKGYLLVIIDNHVYLANSNSTFQKEMHLEYEWFYWELEKKITCAKVMEGILFLGTDDGLYALRDDSSEREIESYWTTSMDDFGYPQYQKTTNKKGCVVELGGEDIKVFVKTDNKESEEIGTYNETKGYIVCRIKKKKWKNIQLKLYSNKPFKFYSATLEAFVGGYIKR